MFEWTMILHINLKNFNKIFWKNLLQIFIQLYFIIMYKNCKKFWRNFFQTFFCLFMIFRISFLIICRNDSTACSYSKLFMLLKFTCDFFRKKLHHNMFVFFYVMRTMHHLKQLLNDIIVSEQQHCSMLFICSYQFNHLENKLIDIFQSDYMKFSIKY